MQREIVHSEIVKKYISKKSINGFVGINLIGILFLSVLILTSSLSFWNILKVRNSLLKGIKKTRSIWQVEDLHRDYQEKLFFDPECKIPECSFSDNRTEELKLVRCNIENHDIEKPFIIVRDLK